jgi:trans-aconitate 2-methyltransferase
VRDDGWDPDHYLRFGGERGRPFAELLARVDLRAPARIVDLGCGPGTTTALLPRRWPDADVLGLDASAAMIEKARAGVVSGVRFERADLRAWAPDAPLDLIVSNAVLQWVPDHLTLLPRLASWLAPGGVVAMQVPGNFERPSHASLRELAADPRFAPYLTDVPVAEAHDAVTYLAALQAAGLEVDAWETTYLHQLSGDDAVFAWVSATAARPFLQALPDGLRERFASEYRARLRDAYSPGPRGTVFPFRRVFAVGRAAGPAA